MNPLAGMDMSRILLDLSNEVIKQLDDLEVQRNLPRADLLREAVDQYLVNQSQTARTSVPGIWQGCEEDGVDPAFLPAFQVYILLPAHEEYGCCSEF